MSGLRRVRLCRSLFMRSANWLVVWVLAFLLAGVFFQAYAGDVKYVYDELGRLVQVIDVSSGNSATYHYDAVGNLLSITTGTGAAGSGVSISNISPDEGPAGTQVTISGSGFSPTTTLDSVNFNGSGATIASASSNTIVATVPAGATTGFVTVSAPGGSATSAERFTVTSASAGPSIASFSPHIGAPGDAVTITGSNFVAGSTGQDHVRFNTTEAQVSSATSGSLSTTVPADGTSGPITVTTPYGQAQTTSSFFVVPPGSSTSSVAYTGQGQADGQTNTTISLPAANDTGILEFTGSANQIISVAFSNSTTGNATVTLYDPDGDVLVSQSVGGSSWYVDRTVLPETGGYSIVVTGNSQAGSVSAIIYNIVDVTGTMNLVSGSAGNSQTVNITTPGQIAQFTFSGNAGQPISLAISNANNPCCNLNSGVVFSIVNPDGSALGSLTFLNQAPNAILSDITLPVTGTYTVIADPTGPTTVQFTQTLYETPDVTGSITVGQTPTDSPVAVNLPIPGQDAVLTFRARRDKPWPST